MRGGEVIALDKKLQEGIVRLQDLIGSHGLKNEIDELWGLIAQINHMSSANVETHVIQAQFICGDLSRALFETWSSIEQLRWGVQHSPEGNQRPDPWFWAANLAIIANLLPSR